MRQRIQVKRPTAVSQPSARPATPPSIQPGTMSGRLLSTLRTYIPGAWIDPRNNELIALYRLRYRMAMEEEKYDTAMIFLNKILELEPMNVEAKLCKGEIYHRCLNDYTKAIEQYNKVLRLTNDRQSETVHVRARAAMAEIMEMLS
jgi:tetratricopeptide (TPR) repeat protein